MAKNRKKRKRMRVRITPMGIVVLSIVALVFVVGIYFVIWSVKNADDVALTNKPTAAPTGPSATDTLPPIAPSATVTLPPINTTPGTGTTGGTTQVTTPPASTDTPAPTIIAGGLRVPTAAEEAAAVDGKLVNSGVVMRNSPDKSGKILGTYTSGTVLKIYWQEGDYYRVKIVKEEKHGYMAVKFVTKFGALPGESATPTPALPAGAYLGTVTAEKGVALRSAASIAGNSPIGECVKGESLYVYYKVGDFYYVEVVATGKKAFAFAQYITVNGTVPTQTPAP